MLEGIDKQTDWQWSVKEAWPLFYNFARQKCWGAWETFWAKTDISVVVWRKEKWREEVESVPPLELGNNLQQTRPRGVLCHSQPDRLTQRLGCDPYGPFQVQQFRLQLKLISHLVVRHSLSLQNDLNASGLFQHLQVQKLSDCYKKILSCCCSSCLMVVWCVFFVHEQDKVVIVIYFSCL